MNFKNLYRTPHPIGCYFYFDSGSGISGCLSFVEQYPDIAPPTIQVSTSYFGASAELFREALSLRWRKRLT